MKKYEGVENESENENPELEELDDFLATLICGLHSLMFAFPLFVLTMFLFAYLRTLIS